MKARNIVVTGAAGALGRMVVEHLRATGFAVAAIDLGDGAELAREGVIGLGGVDLTDEAATRRAFAGIEARLGRLNGLVNVAGGFAWETIGEDRIDIEDDAAKVEQPVLHHVADGEAGMRDRRRRQGSGLEVGEGLVWPLHHDPYVGDAAREAMLGKAFGLG